MIVVDADLADVKVSQVNGIAVLKRNVVVVLRLGPSGARALAHGLQHFAETGDIPGATMTKQERQDRALAQDAAGMYGGGVVR